MDGRDGSGGNRVAVNVLGTMGAVSGPKTSHTVLGPMRENMTADMAFSRIVGILVHPTPPPAVHQLAQKGHNGAAALDDAPMGLCRSPLGRA